MRISFQKVLLQKHDEKRGMVETCDCLNHTPFFIVFLYSKQCHPFFYSLRIERENFRKHIFLSLNFDAISHLESEVLMRQPVAGVSSDYAWLWSWLRAEAPEQPFITNLRARIFLVSFAMLFFELLCIRWIPSYVRYLSYFNNFLLMASFLGIGLGMLTARRKRFLFPPFPLLVLAMVIVVAVNKFDFRITSTDVLYFGVGEAQSASADNFIVLPIIFGMVTLCFIPLARSFGQLFTEVKPLTAYTFDIIGSLAGIACFAAMSFFSLPPLV